MNNVNLHIEKGKIYGFLGPNGAGKTTVMKMITNLWKPTNGHIEIFGEVLTPQSYEVLKRMGSIIEFPTFYDHMTGYQNLKLHCEYMGYYHHGSIEKALDMLGLTDTAAKKVTAYSLGMKERLGIARAILCKPELLILDEPTNGLDPAGIKQIRYLKWPSQSGTVDVYAERNASGELTGVNPFSQQGFLDRTSSLQTAICELEISNTIDGYTSDVENMVKERIAEAYEVYRQYSLTYDRESDRLYYNEELVSCFEDRQISHFFGPFEDSTIKIYAIRDKDGVLTGLNVDLNNDDNPIEKITWEEITEDGVDEELLLRNLDTEVLTQVATELQTLVDEAIAEEKENPMILITEGWARVLEYDRFKKVLEIGAPAMKPLYFILYKSPNRGEYEYLCSYALYKLSDFDFEWSTTDEFLEKFKEPILEERQSQNE